MRRAVETVLFDFGGTLDADGVAWKERFHALYRAEGFDLTPEAFALVFYAADDPLAGALPSTAGLSETVSALAGNLEVGLARRLGQAPDPERGRRVASRFLSDAAAAFARNRPALEALAQSRSLGIVSNFYGNLEAVCESAGLAPLFGALADSQIVGVEKPDPAIFRAALDALGADPETTMFVGDSLRRDGEGARRSGLEFIWISPLAVQAAETPAAAALPMRAALTGVPELLSVL